MNQLIASGAAAVETSANVLTLFEALVADVQAGNPTRLLSNIASIKGLVPQVAEIKGDPSRVCTALLGAARALYVVGDAVAGLDISERAQEIAVKGLDASDHTICLLEVVMSACAIDIGNQPLAIEILMDALRRAEDFGHQETYVKLLVNVSAALSGMGLYAKACEVAKHLFDITDASVPQRGVAAGNLCYFCLKLQRLDEGLVWAERSLESAWGGLSITAGNHHNDVLIGHHHFRLLIALRRHEEAAVVAVRVKASAVLAGNGFRSKVFATICSAVLAGVHGDAMSGVSELERALGEIDSVKGLVPARREILTALIMLHDSIGNTDAALHWVRELTQDLQDASIERAARLASRGLRGVLSSAAAPLDAPDYMTLLEASGAALGNRIIMREQFSRAIEGLERLAVASSLREDESGARPYRVAELASLLAKAHGLGQDAVLHLSASARLHDIGKTAIPDIIAATRNDELNRAAFESHVETGAKMLERSNIPGIKMAVEIARHHHERWDGAGYPSRLVGEQIPLAARIVAIADAFDAMTHARAYRASALSVDDALNEIAALSGRAFDPHLCKLFAAVIKDLVATHPDINIWLGRAASTSGFNKAKAGVWASLKRASDRAPGQTGPYPAVKKDRPDQAPQQAEFLS